MSGTQVSAWQTPNELLTSMQTPALVLHNQLANQGAQQELNANEMEQLSRASNWVIAGDPDNKDPAGQAQRYQAAVGILRQNGYAKNAPDVYPGFEHMQLFARMGTPSKDLYQQTQDSAWANANKIGGGGGGAGAAAPGAGGGSAAPAAAPNAGGATIGQRQNNPGNLSFAGQPYASPGQGNRFASFPDMATGVAANADQLGLYQTQHGINTVRGAVTRWVSDPKADLTSYIADVSKAIGVGPDDKIDLTDPVVQQKFIQAQFPHESAGGGYVLNPADVQKGVQMAAARRGQQVQPTPQVATAAPGGGTTPPPYRVAQAGPLTTPPPTASTVPLVSAPSAAAAAAQPAPVTTIDPETQLPVLSAPPNALAPPPPPAAPAGAAPAATAPAAAAPASAINLPSIPPPPVVNDRGLTAAETKMMNDLLPSASRSAAGKLAWDAQVQRMADHNRDEQQQYATAVAARQDKVAAAQHQAVDEARQAEQLRLSQEAAAALAEQRRIENQRAAEKAAREAAAADPLQQSKSDMADAERVLRALAPKIRAGQELTTDEADRYDIARRAYARGPLQANVPDGKGGTMTAYVGQEVSDRFPPLPGQKEYAGIKPVPGTEKQPDIAPQPVVAGMLLSSTGQQKIATALASLEAHPASVGPTALQPNWLSQRTDPAGVKVRADIGDVAGHILHDMAGTAQSASEAKRLEPFVPTATDTADAIKVKLRRMLDINRETMLQNYRTYGPESNFRRVPVIEEAILGSIPEAAINALKDDPKLARDFDKKYGRGSSKLVLQDG